MMKTKVCLIVSSSLKNRIQLIKTKFFYKNDYAEETGKGEEDNDSMICLAQMLEQLLIHQLIVHKVI